ncbi:MAG: gliding motility-associated C-terminal domain-containing protein [Tenuifilaceae bacterium]|nr:gliding motility-associated C-terminal domain-containing protein [Tenuifilaceae bacterium]
MKRLQVILNLICIILVSVAVQAQPDGKPLKPTFTYLTIDPGTGQPQLFWAPPAFDPEHPNPTGYIIYKQYVDNLGNNDYHEWTTINDPSTLSYIDIASNANTGSVSYTLASAGPNDPSEQTSPHTSMFLTVSYDSCQNKAVLEWNKYVGWRNIDISHYNIYVGNDTNWQNFQKLDTLLNKTLTSFTYIVEPFRDYYFYIELERVNPTLATRSNMVTLNTKRALRPMYMRVDSVIAQENGNHIHFIIDQNSELTTYKLVRWEQKDSVQSIFSAKNLYTFSRKTTNYYLDTANAWAARTRPFHYKLDAYNGCNAVTTTSNLGNSTILRVSHKNSQNKLVWSNINNPHNLSVNWKITREVTQNGATLAEVIFNGINPNDTTWVDDMTPFEGQGYSTIFCYQVEGTVAASADIAEFKSRSRKICVDVTPDIVMPNAIDPSDTRSGTIYPRNIFAPIVSFNATYTLTIYNRWGQIVYQGNEGWNGKLSNGTFAPEGAYVYRLELQTQDAQNLVKTGSLTVIYPRK